MARHLGNEGDVRVSANIVAEVRGWSYEETSEDLDDTIVTSSAVVHGAGLADGSGSIQCFWDETDSTGQEALTVGASVTLNLYPEGSATGDTYWTGTAIVTRASVAVPSGKERVTREIDFVGKLSQSTVA